MVEASRTGHEELIYGLRGSRTQVSGIVFMPTGMRNLLVRRVIARGMLH